MKEELARVKKETAAKIYFRIGLVGLLAVMTISLFSGYGYYVSLFGHPVVFRLVGPFVDKFLGASVYLGLRRTSHNRHCAAYSVASSAALRGKNQ